MQRGNAVFYYLFMHLSYKEARLDPSYSVDGQVFYRGYWFKVVTLVQASTANIARNSPFYPLMHSLALVIFSTKTPKMTFGGQIQVVFTACPAGSGHRPSCHCTSPSVAGLSTSLGDPNPSFFLSFFSCKKNLLILLLSQITHYLDILGRMVHNVAKALRRHISSPPALTYSPIPRNFQTSGRQQQNPQKFRQ